ncbi:hypothetical protein F5878DRAFT_658669 [Lentinula raphanica]|uniref:Uncharacterized protein n=1 Tax=Lentinula raphanica TaxID=153919 RepID=A0AA38PE47_9AGAR|nr:hypothetical protein F5878DRAFT_658669 [Lentinula raphanica]
MENTSSDKAESSKVPETHITRPSRKKGFRGEIKTRITVPRDYQVDYARGRDESYKKPLQLFYGFGLNRKDIMGYYETYISPELPELITPGVKDAFVDDLIKHCDFPDRHTKSAFVNDLVKFTFPKLILEHARDDDQWHGGMYSYILRLYTSYDLPLTELPEEAEQRVFSRLRSRLEGTEGRSTSSVSKEESQDRYKIRTVVPKGFEVDYRRMLDKSYKKPLRLYYGFGVNRNDIMGYIKAFVSSDFPTSSTTTREIHS